MLGSRQPVCGLPPALLSVTGRAAKAPIIVRFASVNVYAWTKSVRVGLSRVNDIRADMR
jgi:hypothetical protein